MIFLNTALIYCEKLNFYGVIKMRKKIKHKNIWKLWVYSIQNYKVLTTMGTCYVAAEWHYVMQMTDSDS